MEKVEVKLEGKKRDRAYQRVGWLDALCLFKSDEEPFKRIQQKIREWDKVKAEK